MILFWLNINGDFTLIRAFSVATRNFIVAVYIGILVSSVMRV